MFDSKILCSGKFLARHRAATERISYSVGYAYHTEHAGVKLTLRNQEQNTMELRMTPEQAEEMAKTLNLWAAKTREYQKTV